MSSVDQGLTSRRLLWKLLRALSPKRRIQGIEVLLDVNAKEVEDEDLFDQTEKALTLIADYQPWRLAQIRRLLDLIIVRRRVSNRAALISPSTAELDWTFVRDHTPEEIAASIIHEAVHARINRWIGRGAEERRARDERLCRRAELSFAAAIPGGKSVRERAAAALAAGDDGLAPSMDYTEVDRLNVLAYWDELDLPDWLKRWLSRGSRRKARTRE